MARGINKVILIGNLGRDPETRYAQGGSAVTNFSVATSDSWKDKSSGEQQERTEWHNVVCFARLAEIAGEYLKKGSKVYIEGSLRTSSWEKDGEKKYRTEVMCRDLQMLDGRGGGQGGAMGGGGGGQQNYDSGGSSFGQGGGGQGGQSGGQSGGQGGQGGGIQPNNAPTLAEDDFEDDIPF